MELGSEARQLPLLKRLGAFSCLQAWCMRSGCGPSKRQQDSDHINRAPTVWPHTSPETVGGLGSLEWAAVRETESVM